MTNDARQNDRFSFFIRLFGVRIVLCPRGQVAAGTAMRDFRVPRDDARQHRAQTTKSLRQTQQEPIVFRRISHCILPSLLFLGLSTSSAYGQKSQPSSEYVHVDAPFAQSLVDKEMVNHSDIGKLGIHAIPLGATDNVIIACNVRSKNGKKSSVADVEKLATGKAVATRIDDEKIFGLFLPMTDAHGGDLKGGFVVMEVPFSKATTEAEALKIGMVVRDELQAQIPGRAALYQP